MRRLVIEIRDNAIHAVYWEGARSSCLLRAGRVVVRDWDAIGAGDQDPLTVASFADAERIFCLNCGHGIEEGEPFQPCGDDGFVHEHCIHQDPNASYCPVHGYALLGLDDQMGLCPVPSHPPRECAQYHPLNGEQEEEE